MGEKKPQPGTGLAEGLNAVGLEMIKGSSRLFPWKDQIYILGGSSLAPLTVSSKHGLTGCRLRRKKGGEGVTHIKYEGQTIDLPTIDLELTVVDQQLGRVLNRYVLVNEEALINDGTRERTITQGFLFWG